MLLCTRQQVFLTLLEKEEQLVFDNSGPAVPSLHQRQYGKTKGGQNSYMFLINSLSNNAVSKSVQTFTQWKIPLSSVEGGKQLLVAFNPGENI